MPTSATAIIESSKVIIASAITYAYFCAEFNADEQTLKSIVSATASSAGTILGFLIAAVALLASIMDKNLIRNLRSTGGYQLLIRKSFICGALHLSLMVISISFLLPWKEYRDELFLLIVFNCSLCVIHLSSTGISFYRIINIISKSN